MTAERRAALKALGFVCYGDYLESTLWWEIRTWVMASRGWACGVCGKRARVVHHRCYSLAVMRGDDGFTGPRHLVPLCKLHHRVIEFAYEGRYKKRAVKRSLRDANAVLARLTREWSAKRRRCKRCVCGRQARRGWFYCGACSDGRACRAMTR